MARRRMVTRTIKQTEVTFLAIDTEEMEPYNDTVLIPSVIKDEKKLEKTVREAVNTDTVKFVEIVKTDIVENYYGMPEEDFIAQAEIIEKPEKED